MSLAILFMYYRSMFNKSNIVILGFLYFPLITFGQSVQIDQCNLLDSIFSHIGDLFPKEPYTHALRIYDISESGNFASSAECTYNFWNIYYFDKLTFDINSGGSVDFVILKDESSDLERRIDFFYAQYFCEKNIRHKMTGYIILTDIDAGINVKRIHTFYLE